MKQPEQSEVKGKEHLVCEKSIYGLKQSSGCWNEALDKDLNKMDDPCIIY